VKVLVVGGSGQGRQVIDTLSTRQEHVVVGIVDDELEVAEVAGIPVVGTTSTIAQCASVAGAEGYVVAIGDNFVRSRLVAELGTTVPDLTLVSAVHAAAVVARDAVVGSGSILLAGSVVGNASALGRGVLMGISSSIDHDCVVGDFASLAPGAHTGGGVTIGSTTALGVGASVIHAVSIGADTVVGSGAAVVRDLPDRVVAFGVPTKVARSREPGDPYL